MRVSTNLYLQDLSKKYSQIRTTRADGNCFFRAFGFGYLEYLLQDRVEYERYKKKVLRSIFGIIKHIFTYIPAMHNVSVAFGETSLSKEIGRSI